MIFLVNFYDNNESGNVEHNEIYTTRKVAERRFNTLKNNLNGYSWVNLYSTRSDFGRVRAERCIKQCLSCCGKDSYYHGDDSDF